MALAQRRLERRIRRRLAGREHRRHLELAAAQARGDLERQRVARSPAASPRSAARAAGRSAGSAAPASPRDCAAAPAAASVVTASAHIVCSSRGGPGSTATSGDEPTRNPGAVPPAPAPRRRPARAPACARPPASPPLRRRIRAAAALTIAQIRSSSAASRTIAAPAHPATTSAVRSSAVGPRPPLVITRSMVARRSPARARRSSGRSPTTTMCASTTPRAAQRLRQPRPVGVADEPRQHLGAGDDDARADAQVAQSPDAHGLREPLGLLARPHLVADRLADVGRGVALAAARSSAPRRCRSSTRKRWERNVLVLVPCSRYSPLTTALPVASTRHT